jgi:hypothetical protein
MVPKAWKLSQVTYNYFTNKTCRALSINGYNVEFLDITIHCKIDIKFKSKRKRLLLNAKWAIFQLYHGKNKLHFWSHDDYVHLLEQQAELDFHSAQCSLKQQSIVDMSFYSDTLFDSEPTSLCSHSETVEYAAFNIFFISFNFNKNKPL